MSAMLSKATPSSYQSSKCFVTHASMGHIDPKQVPHRSKPWASITQLQAIHKVDLLLPQDISDRMRRELLENVPSPCYYKVILSLDEVLEQDFLTDLIKRGSILMLSEGKTTVDNTFVIEKGTLTMYLDKETYDKAGLVGQPHGLKGRRGLKPRWIVQYDLCTPSMRHGKRGFDRLVYAARHVLKKPLTWLLCNVDKPGLAMEPLEKHFPAKFSATLGAPEVVEVRNVHPATSLDVWSTLQESEMAMEANEIYEWLSLIRLGSPRVNVADQIDPYLSRYEPARMQPRTMKLEKLSWQGFISPQWLRDTMVTLLSTCPSKGWFALSASKFSHSAATTTDEMVLLQPSDAAGKYVMWEVKHDE